MSAVRYTDRFDSESTQKPSLPTWRFELVKGVDTIRTSNDIASVADVVIDQLAHRLRAKVSEQRRRINRLEPDFYTESEYRISEEEDLVPPVNTEAAPRIFEIIAGQGSPVVKSREVSVGEIKRNGGARALVPYKEALDSLETFNKNEVGKTLFRLRDVAIEMGKGRPAAGEALDMDMFDRAFSRQIGGDRSTRLDGLRGIDLGR